MDAELRAALRSDDWSERAGAYRRAGEADRARREVARAAREGLEGAREALEEYPLDADARALLEVLEAPPDATQRAAWAAQILWGDGDPRLMERANTWLLGAIERGQGGGRLLLGSQYVEGLGRFLGGQFAGRSGLGLERTLLSGGEGVALLNSRRATDPTALEILQLHFLASASGDESFLGRVQALCAKHSLRHWIEGILGPPRRGQGRGDWTGQIPWRPKWVRPTLRCGLTLALNTHALRGHARAPGDFELPPCEWVLLFSVDGLQEHNGAGGWERADALLRAVVASSRDLLGDRIVRWRGNRFLVPLESEGRARSRELIDSLAANEELVGPAGPTTVSGAVGARGFLEAQRSWALALEEGLTAERGRARLEVLGD